MSSLSMSEPASVPSVDVEAACQEVLSWLREPHRNPMFMVGHSDAKLAQARGRIVERFFSWVIPAGFNPTLRQIEHLGSVSYQVDWTYRGSELVGFKQPPAAPAPAEAQLLASAALLRNEWCRNRLP
jgi:hypothetical protein